MFNIFLYSCIKGASTSTDSSMEGPSKVTLIYFIGGCTHAEISALRFLARQDNSKFIENHSLNTSVLFLRESDFTLKKDPIVRITCATPEHKIDGNSYYLKYFHPIITITKFSSLIGYEKP